MNKIIAVFVFLFQCCWASNINAQNDIISVGGEAFGVGGSLSYSIGQVNYIEQIGNNGSANQGLQQPYEFYILGIAGWNNISIEMIAFPNPTLSELTLKIDEYKNKGLRFQLLSLHGKLLLTGKISSAETIIPMNSLSKASYLLKVYNSETVIKTFKIIKNE